MTDSQSHNFKPQEDEAPEKLLKGHKVHGNPEVIADSVYRLLRDAIVNAELRPNKRLVENELSEWLKVSRTPIREALVCLEKDGLVERDNGWLVHEHTPAEIQARLECRLMIEGYGARLAATRRSDDDLRLLNEFAVSMKKSEASGRLYYAMNDQFHQTIIDAAHNATLSDSYSQVRLNYWNLGVPIVYGTELNQIMLAHHDGIIAAIEKGDSDLAEQISRQHVQTHMELIYKSLQAKNQALFI
jgi:DNA-binding GntR family transcriptional regulator